jgi:hypothetical protein
MSYSPWDTSGPSQIAREGNFYLPGYATKKPPRKLKQASTVDLAALKAYRDKRHTFKECAEKFDSSVHIVSKLLKDHPVTRGLRVQIDVQKAMKLRGEGWSTEAIAKHLKVSARTLYERIGKASPEQKAAVLAKRKKGSKPRQVSMTEAQHAEFVRRGAGKWLRALLSAQSTTNAAAK